MGWRRMRPSISRRNPYTARMQKLIHDLSVTKPDYHGGSIVNLMRVIGDVCGASPGRSPYVPLPEIEERLRNAKRIVLLVIDGLGLELLRHIGRDTIFEQCLVRSLTSVYPPTTASAVTTYMTGLAPQQHGLTGWFMHFRRLGAVTAVLPFVPRFGSDSLCRSGVEIGSLIDCPNFFDAITCPSLAVLPGSICDSDFSRLLGGARAVLDTNRSRNSRRHLLRCAMGRRTPDLSMRIGPNWIVYATCTVHRAALSRLICGI